MSWLFRGIELSENEKLILVGLLGEMHFSYAENALKMLEPFEHYREQELQDLLKELDRHMWEELEIDPDKAPERLRPEWWPVPDPTRAHKLVAELAQSGVHPREVIAAVAMAPEDVQRAAAEALSKAELAARSAIQKYRRAAATLARHTQTPLKQLPIIRLVQLLLRHRYSERRAFRVTADLLSALYPERFEGLKADQVRHRFKHAQKPRHRGNPPP